MHLRSENTWFIHWNPLKFHFLVFFFTSERLAASLEQLNQPDQHRRCPLHMAAFFGKAEAVPRRNPFFGGKGLEIHGMGWVFHHIPYESIWNMMTYVFFESSNHLKIHEFYGNFTIFSRFFRWFHDQPRDGPGKSPILWGNLLRFLMARFYQRVFSDSPKNSANSCGWPTLFSGEDGMNWMIILCLNLVLILTWFSFVVATPSGHLGHLGHGTWFLVATVQPRKIQKPWFSHV